MLNQTNLLLLGETGVGKSSLGNFILDDPNAFSISDSPQSETKITCGKMSKNDKNIFVVDTPGFQDSEGKDKEHIEQMVEYIKTQNLLHAIILVFNYCENEEINALNKSNKTNLEIIKNIFENIDIGGHVGIFFTHYYPNETDENQKNQKEDLKIKEINKIIKSSKDKFPCFYVNIEKNKEPKMSTKVEIMRLIKWIKSLEPIDIKKVNEKAAIKEKITEKKISKKKELVGDYIITYDSVKHREKIIYYDNTIKYGNWSSPQKKNVNKKLNHDLIRKREEEKKEKERQERLKREKEEENRRRQKEEEEWRQKINNIDYDDTPSYHRRRTNLDKFFSAMSEVSVPVYTKSFGGGAGTFSVNVGCNIF
jgi:hypothetical protein